MNWHEGDVLSQLNYKAGAGYDWNRALPIGNGKLGAMIYAPEDGEHYQLNEDSVWFGRARNRNNKDALPNLDKLRNLILEGKIPEAERLLKYAFSGTPQSQHSYQTLGDVYFDYCGRLHKPVEYERKLDLDTAIHSVCVKDERNGALYHREAFSTAVKNCIVTKFSARGEKMELAASLQRLCFYEHTEHTEDSLYITGNLGGGGMDFCCGMKFVSKDAKVYGMGEHLIAEEATEVIVLITAVTEYRAENPRAEVERILSEAADIPYEQLRREHIADYQNYYNRMSLTLAYDTELDKKTTDERLLQISEETPDNGLVKTFFDYGRYLLISCSRGDSLPANLQGLWNNDLNAAWGSKYTININTEMNYWLAGMCNLSDCQLPLFEHMKRMLKNGKQTAKEMYGCKGFVAHHNTDIWGDTAPQDIYIPATYWVMGGAWLCTHIYDHYEFTGDKEFLKDMYPLLKESVRFFLDFLIEVDGEYVTCPSVSPENTFIMENGVRGCITAGATMDNEILRELFSDFLTASELVNDMDTEYIERARHCLEKLPPIKIGRYGQIMEWRKDYEEAEPGHRHISHLWALHPAFQITPDGDEKMCQAAAKTLERRLEHGGGHTGWSRAWIINMFARLWNGEKAYENLMALLQKSTFSNLLDAHPPFQIDGNFGAVSGMGEMFLQSNIGRAVILPALPRAFQTGCIEGICARGGAKYHIHFRHHELTEVEIIADRDYEAEVTYDGKKVKVKMKAGTQKKLLKDEFI